jgi:dihydrofolate synthase / folylpolyglutamate synthase
MEKAGIFRSGRPAVFGARAMPESIARRAAELNAPLMRLGVDFDFTRATDTWSWRSAQDGLSLERLPPPALFGPAQFDNAAAVLQVLRCLQARLPVDRHAIETGLRTVRLAGRFQVIAEQGVEWVLDVAHNPAAAKTLATQLRVEQPRGRTIAVCGILSDKDIAGIAAELRSSFSEWIVAGLDGPRALSPAVLSERLRASGITVDAAGRNVEEACAVARRRAQDGDRIVIFGSFLTVAPALQWLQRSKR